VYTWKCRAPATGNAQCVGHTPAQIVGRPGKNSCCTFGSYIYHISSRHCQKLFNIRSTSDFRITNRVARSDLYLIMTWVKLIFAKSHHSATSPSRHTRHLDNEDADIGRFRLVTALQARNYLATYLHKGLTTDRFPFSPQLGVRISQEIQSNSMRSYKTNDRVTGSSHSAASTSPPIIISNRPETVPDSPSQESQYSTSRKSSPDGSRSPIREEYMPSLDLSCHLILTSLSPMFEGTYSDVYKGKCLGQEASAFFIYLIGT
jgi:hypothetical protein